MFLMYATCVLEIILYELMVTFMAGIYSIVWADYYNYAIAYVVYNL
jgi:hypothetical protein